MNFKILLLSSLALFLSLPIAAQDVDNRPEHYCGVTESHPWMDAYLAGEIGTPRSIMPLVIPLRFIIVGRTDGTGYPNANELLGSVCRMNEEFENSNISFFIDSPFDTINNSNYWDHSFSTGGLMMAFNNQSGVINIYVVGSPAGNCGYYSGSRDAIAIDKDCLGYNALTLAHEVGHFLTLRHTFFGWEGEGSAADPYGYLPTEEQAPNFINSRQVEKADSSNCNVAADGFCDTAPDYISERWTCNSLGIFPDSLVDPDSTLFAVSGANIMSYSSDGCADSFSIEQITAMEINMNSRSSLHSSEVHDQTEVPQTVQVSPANNEVLNTSDYALLSWEAVPDADFYLIELNNTQFFNNIVLSRYISNGTSYVITDGLIPNRNYYWRVRGVNKHAPCDDNFSSVRKFRNGIISATIDPVLDAAISVFPNPLSNGQDQLYIQATSLPTTTELNYELINTTGQVLLANNSTQLVASGFQEVIDLSGISQGVYFLRIRLGERFLTRRVVVH